jgi:hypothetical protein
MSWGWICPRVAEAPGGAGECQRVGSQLDCIVCPR